MIEFEVPIYKPTLPVATVWLQPDHITPGGLTTPKIFFCSYCRTPIAEFIGLIAMIVPGNPPMPYPARVQCPNNKCKSKWVFEQLVGIW